MAVEDDVTNSSLAPKVRLVKCPGCVQVLQERVDVPIYRCGGCGVILQAKRPRKNDSKIMGPDQQKSNEFPPERTPGDLTRNVLVPSSAENSVDFQEPGDQSNSIDATDFTPKRERANGDQLGKHNHSKGTSLIFRCCRCGSILQGPDQQKSVELPPEQTDNASEDKDPGGLTCDVQVPSSAENSVDFKEPKDQSISIDVKDFTPKEEMPVCANGDQLGEHNHSKAEDTNERNEEFSGMRSSTELESCENGGSSPMDERNSEREASGESSRVPRDNFAEETKGSDTKFNKMITTSESSSEKQTAAEEIMPTDARFSMGPSEERFKRTSPCARDPSMSMETTASTMSVDPFSDFSGTLAETPRLLGGKGPCSCGEGSIIPKRKRFLRNKALGALGPHSFSVPCSSALTLLPLQAAKTGRLVKTLLLSTPKIRPGKTLASVSILPNQRSKRRHP